MVMNSDFHDRVLSTFARLKSEEENTSIPIIDRGRCVAELRPVTVVSFAADHPDIERITAWRNQNRKAFFSWFTATPERTARWLETEILGKADRLLFMLERERISFGHIGLANFDFAAQSYEVDSIVRGRKDIFPGGMTLALRTVLRWTFDTLGARSAFLRVFSDNEKAIALYQRCGFRIIKRVPLGRIDKEGDTLWVEQQGDLSGELVERYAVYMSIQGRKTCLTASL